MSTPPPVSLILSGESGSMDALGEALAARLPVRRVQMGPHGGASERYGVGPLAAAGAAADDFAILRRLRRIRGLIHFPSHHFARYGRFVGQPYVVTVHDLIRHHDCHSAQPLIHRPDRRDRMLLALDRAGIRAAGAVIAISQWTRGELLRHLQLDPERIRVIPPGIDRRRFHPVPAPALPYPYLLFVGSEQPRKNLAGLLRAFALLKRDPRFAALKLVKVGNPGGDEGPFRERLRRDITSLGLEREVVLRGHVAHAELLALYSGARSLVLPSLHEGFGLPPLEAMACDCPAVVSDRSALPETAGPGALISSPEPAALATRLGQLLDDENLRDSLVARGRAHVQRFRWDAAAAATISLYERLGDEPPCRRREVRAMSMR